MAATDQTYRSQRILDIVFAVTCVLMLVSIVWMFAQDQYRDWKVEQREFRNVEEAITQRAVLRAAPDQAKMDEIDNAQQAVADARKKLAQAKQAVAPQVNVLLPKKVESEVKAQTIKADLDSKLSFLDEAVDKRNRATKGPAYDLGLDLNVGRLQQEVAELKKNLAAAQAEVAANTAELNNAMMDQTQAEEELGRAEDKLKELAGDFDRFHKLAEQKKWGFGDTFRSLPVLDAFASPIRIQQYTLDELPINYSFKYVTRYDRCTTCHMGIDRGGYDKAALADLDLEISEKAQKDDEKRAAQLEARIKTLKDRGEDKLSKEEKRKLSKDERDLEKVKDRLVRRPPWLERLNNAKASLKKRREISKDSKGLDPDNLSIAAVSLTPQQIVEYASHPRLDLFVDGNSPHAVEKFGCSICHGGQGSATSFLKASHSPNTIPQKHHWEENPKLEWEHDHFWDFPMLPKRFLESSCIKCHHQITDLIREGSKNEAPKLLKGYNLVRENGCFGCHEISGFKAGRSIGPDLRLEPNPPLDAYTPAEKVKLLADTQNPPGTMRKVGPSLRRISEKTNADWMRLWVKSPRTFRPDTKMPHFYMLSNNNPQLLGDKLADQRDFPDAEIHSIVHYLLSESDAYLHGSDIFLQATKQRLNDLKAKDPALHSDKEKQEIDELERRLQLFTVPTPIAALIKNLPEEPKDDKAKESLLKEGRKLFSEKGCLACHINNNTANPGNGLPGINGESHFAPNLTRLAAKLGTKDADGKLVPDSARRWLVQWIMNPTVYHPRTFMPITHLDLDQANAIATWLLAQKVDWPDAEEKKLETATLKQPKRDTLQKLASVYLDRVYPRRKVEEIVTKGLPEDEAKSMKLDQDERLLAGNIDDNKLKKYIGKKAVGNMGCFACHDVPGFEYAKPIGTPLNDWGKKDPERLAFEDAAAYVRKNHYFVDSFEKDGKPVSVNEKGQKPYDRFLYESLDHHGREGFLNQKLTEPRSYDYDRQRVWDERLRMPQFKFARTEKRADEKDEEFQDRSLQEEAEAREAVMTFILGLIAEPIPAKYVYNPPPDRLAEAKGRMVLDKYNCNGCHLVRSGVYDFKSSKLGIDLLQASHKLAANSIASDYKFTDHNAWTGTNPVNGPRQPLHGLGRLVDVDQPDPQLGNEKLREFLKSFANVELPPDMKNVVVVRLTQATRYTVKRDGKDVVVNIPAYELAFAPAQDMLYPPAGEFNGHDIGPYGGTFGNQLVKYRIQVDGSKYPADQTNPNDSAKARPAVPPLLLRQGEKTQPDWLFRFLRDPQKIRPMAVLRMPKFNMSDEEAAALVNYFASADRLSNPAFGVQYPYFTIKERDDSYLLEKNARYLKLLDTDPKAKDARLKELTPVWDKLVKDQADPLKGRLNDAENRVKSAKEALDKEKDNAKKKELQDAYDAAVRSRDGLKKEIDRYTVEALRKEWQDKDAYAIDSFRLVAGDGKSVCLTCHSVGRIEGKDQQGPQLDQAWQRLRPEWTQRWIANPQRFLTYQTWMPQNIKPDKPEEYTQYLFVPPDKLKTPEQKAHAALFQVTGARDFLMMYPKVIDLPTVRHWPPPAYEATPTGGK